MQRKWFAVGLALLLAATVSVGVNAASAVGYT